MAVAYHAGSLGIGAVLAFIVGWFVFGLLGAILLAIVACLLLGIITIR